MHKHSKKMNKFEQLVTSVKSNINGNVLNFDQFVFRSVFKYLENVIAFDWNWISISIFFHFWCKLSYSIDRLRYQSNYILNSVKLYAEKSDSVNYVVYWRIKQSISRWRNHTKLPKRQSIEHAKMIERKNKFRTLYTYPK